MPVSRLPNRNDRSTGRGNRPPGRGAGSPDRVAGRASRSAPPSRSFWPWVFIAVAALLAVVIATLPASIAAHFLPPSVHAQDFSGSLWHGSAGKVSINARDAGALEWRLHPAALLHLAVTANLHWVKGGFVINGSVEINRAGYTARGVEGGGPIEDLNDFGVAPGWHGTAAIDFSEIKGDFVRPLSAVGQIDVSHLASAQIAQGATLGSYHMQLAQGAISLDGITAQLSDSGGPLAVQASIHCVATQRTCLLSGTVKERPDVPPALRSQLNDLAQLHGRDAQGRIPVEFEFSG